MKIGLELRPVSCVLIHSSEDEDVRIVVISFRNIAKNLMSKKFSKSENNIKNDCRGGKFLNRKNNKKTKCQRKVPNSGKIVEKV